jgi:hypothetical protein
MVARNAQRLASRLPAPARAPPGSTCGGRSRSRSTADSRSLVGGRRRPSLRAIALRRGGRDEVALRQQRTAERERPRAIPLDQDPREPRVQRQPVHARAEGRECRALHGPELREQVERRAHPLGPRRVEPLQRERIAAPGQDVEQRARQIHPMDVRFAMRPQPIRRVPQTDGDPGPEPRGPARALIGRVPRDALGLEAVDRAVRIVPRDLVEPRVDDRLHAGHGQRRLRDVGREDHARATRRRERGVLRGSVERSVQLHDLHTRQRPRYLRQRPPDLGGAGEETQDLSRLSAPGCRLGHRVGQRGVGPIPHVERKRLRPAPSRSGSRPGTPPPVPHPSSPT